MNHRGVNVGEIDTMDNPMQPWGNQGGNSQGPVAPLVVGGEDAQARSYMASIQYPDGDHECGGSLIADRWVITARHCAPRIVPGQFHVRIGSADRTTGGTLAGIQQVFSHPLGAPDKAGNDVALILLDQAVPQKPIPIARRAGQPGTPTRIFGFGITCDSDFNDPSCIAASRMLQQLDTKIAPDRRCSVADPQTGVRFFDPATELCTVSRDGKKKMGCFGDSGGPQVEVRHGREVLIGATSGDGDDWELRPNVCTTAPDGRNGAGIWSDLTSLYRWIMQTLRKNDPRAADEVELSSAAV
ncbi:trypsin-like serine protease [Umezawaea endophytica]|uniref:Serine protease n=1 Tax=Umezawaea endophytica TaxID=1654476 RepID=A0A9X2VZL7_9PSEU|nr:serine protease [Umezawaea endophytica]MCS7484688.1 serine protease [Umezawaea endophytica]